MLLLQTTNSEQRAVRFHCNNTNHLTGRPWQLSRWMQSSSHCSRRTGQLVKRELSEGAGEQRYIPKECVEREPFDSVLVVWQRLRAHWKWQISHWLYLELIGGQLVTLT